MATLEFDDGKVIQKESSKEFLTLREINKLDLQTIKALYIESVKEIKQLRKDYQDLSVRFRKFTGKVPKPVVYLREHYPTINEKLFQVCKQHRIIVRNYNNTCSFIIDLLEGNKDIQPVFSSNIMEQFLDILLKYNQTEYRKIKFAPAIYSVQVMFEKHQQIIRAIEEYEKENSSNETFSKNVALSLGQK